MKGSMEKPKPCPMVALLLCVMDRQHILAMDLPIISFGHTFSLTISHAIIIIIQWCVYLYLPVRSTIYGIEIGMRVRS